MKNLSLRIETDSAQIVNDEDILHLFGPYFNKITVRYQTVDELRYKSYKVPAGCKVLSMDPLYRGDYNIEISRRYRPFGVEWIGHFSRPEAGRSLIRQFRCIPKGERVVIFEDDIGFGGQIRRVKQILAKMGVEVVDVFTLYNNSTLEDEVLDMRDFLLDAPYGGLVVRYGPLLPAVRVPYLFPLIDVKERCSIDNVVEFSLRMWEFNLKFAKDADTIAVCKDMIEECRNVKTVN